MGLDLPLVIHEKPCPTCRVSWPALYNGIDKVTQAAHAVSEDRNGDAAKLLIDALILLDTALP